MFEPITFRDGFNIILGQTDDSSDKTNGVGKSLCIEFINYCLMKRASDSRVSKIPKKIFPLDHYICLDFELGGSKVVVKRSFHDPELITLSVNDSQYTSIDYKQCLKKLSQLYQKGNEAYLPSFRSIVNLIARDEKSEFKSIVKCHDTSKRIPSDYSPHLFFLGISPESYEEAKSLVGEIDTLTKAKTKLKKDIELITGKDYSEVNADLNELKDQLSEIKSELEKLESSSSYEIVRDELIALDDQLDSLRAKLGVHKAELSKIKLFRGNVFIDSDELSLLYNKFSSGLGDSIKKNLDEVQSFKNKIDEFQHSLLNERRVFLQKEVRNLTDKIISIEDCYKSKAKLLDSSGNLRSLKKVITIYQKKLDEQSQLSSFIGKHDDYERQLKRKKQDKINQVAILDAHIFEGQERIEALKEEIFKAHKSIMGNNRCHFEIQTTDRKDILQIELRIFDDGSHSNEREKVFIYDISMLNMKNSDHHPGLLIHDNIFDVDQDTLVKSLNFAHHSVGESLSKQYILTLNEDKLHPGDLALLDFSLDYYAIAHFTKSDRFLKEHYQER
ncbi:Uncharacterized protein YydD, contains DUF2326 domain [Ferrimonas sediminum]|uniref:Uncharacterized protein YydD, contains DUF2326 domain n=2 Tax=Ferrimonas sediminum TaxID=718193 RepID=A0A1G8U0V5_9GAMM|nr:Uncharacterized protein YydD, contains DUF2326 domain [Ferrimonas sediminum]